MAYVVRDANERMERLIASLLALASSEAGIVQARGGRPGRDRGAGARPRGRLRRGRRAAARCRARARRRSWAIRCCSSAWPRTSSRTRSATTRPSAGCGVRTGIERGEAVLHVANAGARIDPARRRGAARALPPPGVLARALDRRLRARPGRRPRRGAGPWRPRRRAGPPRGRPRGDGLAADGLLGRRRADRQHARAASRRPAACAQRRARSRLRPLHRFYSRRFYGSSGRFRCPENPEEGSGARTTASSAAGGGGHISGRRRLRQRLRLQHDGGSAPKSSAARATSTAPRPARARRAVI